MKVHTRRNCAATEMDAYLDEEEAVALAAIAAAVISCLALFTAALACLRCQLTFPCLQVLGAMGYGGLSSTQGNSNAFYNLDESADDASDCFAYFGQEMLQLAQTSGVGTPFGVPYGERIDAATTAVSRRQSHDAQAGLISVRCCRALYVIFVPPRCSLCCFLSHLQ